MTMPADKMTDAEIVRKCAEAMFDALEWEQRLFAYDPLHDDAQAMALVKRFKLWIMPHYEGLAWLVSDANDTDKYQSSSDDLNRAICECVAKLHAAD
jgi:hypothetical protein